jgi:hypothetical protein
VLVGEAVRRFGGGVVTPAGEYTLDVEDPCVLMCRILCFVLSSHDLTWHNGELREVYRAGEYDGLGV